MPFCNLFMERPSYKNKKIQLQSRITSQTEGKTGRQTDTHAPDKISHMAKKIGLYTRNSSEDEIANMNFLYDDVVHALENTTASCINSATDRFLQRRFTKFSEITQCNGHYAVQDHSRSPMLVPVESSYTTSYWWRRGVAVERRTRDREVVGSSLGRALRRKNSGQVSHTYG